MIGEGSVTGIAARTIAAKTIARTTAIDESAPVTTTGDPTSQRKKARGQVEGMSTRKTKARIGARSRTMMMLPVVAAVVVAADRTMILMTMTLLSLRLPPHLLKAAAMLQPKGHRGARGGVEEGATRPGRPRLQKLSWACGRNGSRSRVAAAAGRMLMKRARGDAAEAMTRTRIR